MSDELELKYALDDPERVRDWLDRHLPPEAFAGDWAEQAVVDLYFETADGRLGRAGYGARLRTKAGQTTVGLKADVGVDSPVHRRAELEAPATLSLDWRSWPHSEVRALVSRLVGEFPLAERFVLRQRRQEREYRPDRETCVLLSLDWVVIEHRGSALGELRQLEAELRSGKPEVLYRLGRLLETSLLLRPEPQSKMAQAQQLVASAVEGTDQRSKELTHS